MSPTPREQSRDRLLTFKKLGYASLADYKRTFIEKLAVELADGVKRYWFTNDTSADWERLACEDHQAAISPKSDAATVSDSSLMSGEAPVNDATALALRARFKNYMSLEFASEVLRQIQHQLESRDDRGRPLILARDAKQIADMARVAAASLAGRVGDSPPRSRFADSPILRPLIAAGSRRVLSQRVKGFDPRQPEHFLPADTIDELIQTECRDLLEESLTRPDISAAINALIELDTATVQMLECSTADPLHCGSERRTLVFVPKDEEQLAITEMLRLKMPLAAVVPAAVDDVLVISEEAGISPQALALAFEREFPGVADAARRLHTRIDVNWQSLI
jgi:hypothetical protein